MKIKSFLKAAGQVILLTIAGMLAMIVSSRLLPQPAIVIAAAANPSPTAFPMVLLSRFVIALAVYYAIRVSSAGGIKLMLYLFCAMAGFSAILSQMETLFFAKAFPALSHTDILLLGLTGLVTSLIFTPLAVIIMGRIRKTENPYELVWQKGFAPKLLILSVIYPAVYFFFGYFVALNFQEIREFYSNDPAINNTLILVSFQVLRGALWVLFGLPFLSLVKDRKHKILVSAALYSIFISIGLITPNPLMPFWVRIGHFIELMSSMTLYGALVGIIIGYKNKEKKAIDSCLQNRPLLKRS
jgi:hypothetical protein